MIYQLINTAAVLLFYLIMFGYLLARKDSSCYRVLLYFFFVAICCCGAAMYYATSTGAIDAGGKPTNEVGNLIANVTMWCVDLNDEFRILGAILFVLFVPQILTYGVSGLSGNGQQRLMYAYAIDWSIYAVAKAIITFCGVSVVIVPFAYWNNIKLGTGTLPPIEAILYTALPVGMLGLPMMLLCFVIYRQDFRIPKLAQKIIARAHAWMTRNEPRAISTGEVKHDRRRTPRYLIRNTALRRIVIDID